MAKKIQIFSTRKNKIKKRTSIGDSVRSRPNNKNKRRCWKKYKGQGKYINITYGSTTI